MSTPTGVGQFDVGANTSADARQVPQRLELQISNKTPYAPHGQRYGAISGRPDNNTDGSRSQ
jgi:hypothetical protein